MLLWKCITKEELSYSHSFIILFRSLTWQSINKDIRKFCGSRNYYRISIFNLTFIIWVISSLILSKSFTGLLLNSYFNIKYIPVVNTLQDIRNNKDVLIWANHGSISFNSKINHVDIDDIIERNKENKTHSFKQIELIIKGNGVLLLSTSQRKAYIDRNKIYQDRLFISETKYLPNYVSFVVKRNQVFTEIVKLL